VQTDITIPAPALRAQPVEERGVVDPLARPDATGHEQHVEAGRVREAVIGDRARALRARDLARRGRHRAGPELRLRPHVREHFQRAEDVEQLEAREQHHAQDPRRRHRVSSVGLPARRRAGRRGACIESHDAARRKRAAPVSGSSS